MSSIAVVSHCTASRRRRAPNRQYRSHVDVHLSWVSVNAPSSLSSPICQASVIVWSIDLVQEWVLPVSLPAKSFKSTFEPFVPFLLGWASLPLPTFWAAAFFSVAICFFLGAGANTSQIEVLAHKQGQACAYNVCDCCFERGLTLPPSLYTVTQMSNIYQW